MASDTRHRIVESTSALLRQRGYTGTGLKQISTGSGAPFGSLYHFFPGGKVEMAAEALRWSGRGYAKVVNAVLDAAGDDVVAAMRVAFDAAAANLEATDYADACPIATVALEVASTNEPLRQVTAEIFEGWLGALDARFEAAGVPAGEVRRISTLFLAALEGGFLLSRAAKDPAPMLTLGASVAEAVERAVPARS
jgi:AcrR family transcriptional regulator